MTKNLKPRKGKEKTTAIPKDKLSLSDTLAAIDRKDYEYYNNLSDEFKKLYSAFVLMRFVSSASTSGGLHEYYVQMVNDYVNTEFWTLSKYPDLQHKLLCLCGVGTKQYHGWIANKKEKEPKWIELIKRSNTSINRDEIAILKKSYTSDDIFDMAVKLGKSDKETKEYAKSYKE